MCGIAGIITLDENKSVSDNQVQVLREMLNRMKYRGPDQIATIEEEKYALGTARLTIVGSETGKQPVTDNDSSLVFNGEIYNYKELSRDYLSSETNPTSDSYILLKFLQAYGVDKINLLNGMFSFCYVDKDAIYLVRDRFGKKPFYYTIEDGYLLFASELKAFIGIVDFELAIPSLYAQLETTLDGESIFKNIFEVESAGYIKIDRKNNNLLKHKYFTLHNIQQERGSEKYLIEKLRWLVEDAVKIRTDTNLELGSFISGGIDSSILALLAKPHCLLTYLPNSAYINAEEQYADILSSKLPESIYLKVTSRKEDILKHLIDTVYCNGGPTTTLAACSQYALSEALSTKGIRIALSGLGADEFFNGYARHAISLLPEGHYMNPFFKQYKSLVDLALPQKSIAAKYASLLNRSSEKSHELTTLVDNIFRNVPTFSSALSICDATFTLPPLLHTDDHLNMAFGIESRAPFLDYRIVSFALGLSDDMKVRVNSKGNLYLKYILKEAFKDILPNQIYLRQDKIGFSSNINDFLRGDFKGLVKNSKAVLAEDLPAKELLSHNVGLNPYLRHEYQLVQLAITYLIYCRKYTQKDVELVLSKGM